MQEGVARIGGPKQGVEAAGVQETQTPLLAGFQGKVFKDRVREAGYGVGGSGGNDQLADTLLIGWK